MTALSISRHADEPSVEVTIETSGRMPVPSYTSILSQVAWSLDEIDRAARPGKAKRIQWGIVEVGGSTTIQALLAPVSMPPKVESGTVQMMANGLVSGLRKLDGTPEIPELFSPTTLRRVERVGSAMHRGHIEELKVASLNGHRSEAKVTEQTYSNAALAITGKTVSFGSISGVLDVLDARPQKGVRAQIFMPFFRYGVMVRANPEHAPLLKELWGGEVVASGEIRRNSRGQAVSVDLHELSAAPERQPISPWKLLGIHRGITGDSSTTEYLEMIRGR